ncbi:hypothetical protein AB0A76_26700 [Streptomyces exfoliatus]|uniref:Uncharacterized protein n=1 Tax=Streptomyces exfoliatus TaxID=1905 RepID=A0ABV3D2Q9_STREX
MILSDGFAPEGTNVDNLYDGLENGDYPFISTLRQAGFDVILLGFDNRVSILDNADALYGKIDAERSDLHGFRCATTNEGHTVMTRELGEWIVTSSRTRKHQPGRTYTAGKGSAD